MGFAREVADRMLFFDHGLMVEQGTPQQLFADPQHERTKLFLSQIFQSRCACRPRPSTNAQCICVFAS